MPRQISAEAPWGTFDNGTPEAAGWDAEVFRALFPDPDNAGAER